MNQPVSKDDANNAARNLRASQDYRVLVAYIEQRYTAAIEAAAFSEGNNKRKRGEAAALKEVMMTLTGGHQ